MTNVHGTTRISDVFNRDKSKYCVSIYNHLIIIILIQQPTNKVNKTTLQFKNENSIMRL